MVGLWRSFPTFALGVLLAAATCLPVTNARSAPRDEDLFLRPEDMHTVLFGSLDAGRSAFVNVGAKRTLTGSLDRPGFVAMETNGIGLTRERFGSDPAIKVMRVTTEASALLGYQWTANGIYAALFAGPELHQEQLTIAAAAGRWSEPRIGFRGQAELWANPTRNTLFTATVVAGTTRASLWARSSAGIRIWRELYVGPEAVLYVTDSYRETKVGLHLTGIDLGIVHLRVSAGMQTQSATRGAAGYLALTSWIRL
jgi:hypothetical protein